MNQYLIESNYQLNVSDIMLLSKHFGTELYIILTDTGKYIVKVMPLFFENVDNEGYITDFLSSHGLKVAKLLKNKSGYYATKLSDFQFTIQEYIMGETLPINSAPEWFMEKSAEFLGKTALYLHGYDSLPLRFGKDFFTVDTVNKKKTQYIRMLKEATLSGDFDIVPLWETQIHHLDRISNFHIDTDKLTYTGSHGDYHIGQAIIANNDIAIIDWTSACRLPICLEIITSYVFASPTCINGIIDADGLIQYVRGFSKYFPLTEYDIKAMPYVLYFWHCICNYRPDEYASIPKDYQPIAKLINNLLNWLYNHVDEFSDALID